MRMQRLCVAILVCSLIPWAATATDQVSGVSLNGIQFSREDLEVLKDLKNMEDSAGIASSVLKAQPFIDLLNSTSAADLLITVTMNDWDKMPAAVRNIRKVAACKMYEVVSTHLSSYLSDRVPTGKALTFFKTLERMYDAGC
jgi:hypothetical protein